MIQAIGNYVLLRQTMTALNKSSILLADGAKDETKYKVDFEILNLGDGALCQKTSLKTGDKVLIDKSGQASYMEEVERKQGELVILEGLFFIHDIIGKITE